MLDELQVTDIALIQNAVVVPSRGLTVLTGETGAGKTALVSAFKLLAGERGDSTMVRQGAKELCVEGRFFANGGEGDGCVVRRNVGVDGRSRVYVDGHVAAVSQLAEGVGATIDLCGQHEHQRLMKAANHRLILDEWIGDGHAVQLAEYRQALARARAAKDAIDAVRLSGQLDAAQIEHARFTLRSIDEAHPSQEEYDELSAAVPRLEHAESLLVAFAGAHDALSGEGGALDTLGRAASLLDSIASFDETAAAKAASLREASYVLEDVARDVRTSRESLDLDASALASMQDRLGTLAGLMRSWGPTISEVLAARDQAQATIEAFESYDAALARAQAVLDEAEAALAQAADALSVVRSSAAPRFANLVNAQMERLELGGATLECVVEKLDRAQWGDDGADRVEFLFRPGANMSPRPLAKIASGGEVSRVMLAIKVVLGEADSVETLVFDEVDAGVGGATARALADVLCDLARTHQVIVVTHVPQVAVGAQAHYVVRKIEQDAPQTVIEKVQGDKRVEEIARMLSGDTGQAALAHARDMLLEAQG